MNSGFIRKIAVLCKDFYTLRTIDDLFIYAGADSFWPEVMSYRPTEEHPNFVKTGSERMDAVYFWIGLIQEYEPSSLNQILAGVAEQLIDHEGIKETDKNFLRRQLANVEPFQVPSKNDNVTPPESFDVLLEKIIKGLPRAMFPLKNRRKSFSYLDFDNEYDLQSLFHALLRPWVRDIRPEDYTPSYAGSSTRVDFLCPKQEAVIEIKYVRDQRHAKNIGDELIIDIGHYNAHEKCKFLWIVIYDPHHLVLNPQGIISDLNGKHQKQGKTIDVKTFILSLEHD
jgi:hypothetical protein